MQYKVDHFKRMYCGYLICPYRGVTFEGASVFGSTETYSLKGIPFFCRESNDLMPTLFPFLTANNWISDVNYCNLQKYVFPNCKGGP